MSHPETARIVLEKARSRPLAFNKFGFMEFDEFGYLPNLMMFSNHSHERNSLVFRYKIDDERNLVIHWNKATSSLFNREIPRIYFILSSHFFLLTFKRKKTLLNIRLPSFDHFIGWIAGLILIVKLFRHRPMMKAFSTFAIRLVYQTTIKNHQPLQITLNQ